MKIYEIGSAEFLNYGKIIDCPFFDLFQNGAQNYALPETGSAYMASVPEFETRESLEYYRAYYGDMDVQIGYCWGKNDVLNGLEWHKSPEVLCALSDMILLLGDQRDIVDGTYDTAKLKAFELKKGQSVEIYQTTLHFCPMMTEGKPFFNVVILPRGTNTALGVANDDKRLIMRNKWFVCHPESKKHVDSGRAVGLVGENITIK